MTDTDFRGFLRTYERSFEHFARVMARRNEDEANDFLSRAMWKAWLKFERKQLADVDMHMKNYIFRCIKNAAIKRYHQKKRFVPISEGIIMELKEMGELIGSAALADRLDEVLAELPHDLELAVRVCCLSDAPLTPEEAAKHLDYSVATMYRRLEEARELITSGFEELGFGLSF
jgi:RNA polymerase sigma factor (sigma-70 family)